MKPDGISATLASALFVAMLSGGMTTPSVSQAEEAETGWTVGGTSGRRHDGRPHGRVGRHEWDGPRRPYYRRGSRGEVTIGGDGLPTEIPGAGTYVGGIRAYRDRGNGNYFYRDGDGGTASALTGTGGKPDGAKVIEVNPKSSGAACDRSHGVCVIRP